MVCPAPGHLDVFLEEHGVGDVDVVAVVVEQDGVEGVDGEDRAADFIGHDFDGVIDAEGGGEVDEDAGEDVADEAPDGEKGDGGDGEDAGDGKPDVFKGDVPDSQQGRDAEHEGDDVQRAADGEVAGFADGKLFAGAPGVGFQKMKDQRDGADGECGKEESLEDDWIHR